MRMSVEETDGMTIINDCYNASPDSIRAALKVLGSIKGKRRVAILGDVLEMGGFAPKAHYELGQNVFENAQALITAGENSEFIAKGAAECGMKEVYSFKKTLEACNFAKKFVQPDDAVLIKASRGMHFEEIYEALTEK